MAVILLSTLLNAAYFVPVIYAAWFRPTDDDIHHAEAPLAIVIALMITAGLTLLLFLFPGMPLGLAQAIPGGD